MKIKPIELSQKKGGNGYTSSFSVSIGSKEANECGLTNGEATTILCKIIDDEKQQIIIKAKRLTVTEEVLNEVITLADERWQETELHEIKRATLQEGFDRLLEETSKGKKAESKKDKLKTYLNNLSVEELSDIATYMNIGRNQDADMHLPSMERFIDYWDYIMQHIPNTKRDLVFYLVEKVPLADYLRKGIAILKLPRETDPGINDEEEFDGGYEEWT